MVYFARLLSICHEAYEASLAQAGIDQRSFFGGTEVLVPIVHAEINFYAPVYCGDHLQVHLSPAPVNSGVFVCSYEIYKGNTKVAQAQTKHCCVDAPTRHQRSLTPELRHWLGADEPQN